MVSPPDRLRLLPWAGPEGKPCYLAGDGTGYVSRLADNVESAQLDLAGEILQEAQRVLDSRQWTSGELHLLTIQLNEALTQVRQIAISRGARLPAPAYEDPAVGDDTHDQQEEASQRTQFGSGSPLRSRQWGATQT
ncbi:hypothetical protein [Streptomyces sp. V3I7]|uniref:hypothetical protein n=1 Tax=Streptomyces sp. V3I7 TaxID=3042278 RepID=UPI002782E545|nr:hypothetical protein [Streptomyces sp. V3I7]MDQ0991343.1 hypothetical protein [Streptomyces sp. V3I7]